MDTPRPMEPPAGTKPTRQPRPEEMEQAVELFNCKPKKGIAFLIESHIINDDPKAIVNFLLNATGISRHKIGDYLGAKEAERVLDALAMTMDFRDAHFDECIRVFFKEFFPPGEAHVIYSMMSKFGERYHQCNPATFNSEDAATVLAYATLMLNTDLHNKSIKSKMSKDQFVKNLRGADAGHDIPRAYLEELFDRVAKHEIEMMDDNEFRGGRPAGTQWRSDIIKTLCGGAQFKKYGRRGSPHQRYVWVTADLQFVCYGTKKSGSPDNKIAVKAITQVLKGLQTPVFARVDAEERTKIEKRCLSLDAPRHGEGRTLDLEASSEVERKKWYDAFRFLIQGYLTD